MLAADRDDLICDLAETYGIYDMRSLPATTIAVLADGLAPESRIKRRLSGRKDECDFNTLLMARMADMLALLVWMQTKDGAKGRNRPESIVQLLLKQQQKPKEKDFKTFKNPEDFLAAWKSGGGA